jgi:hypothetical protein
VELVYLIFGSIAGLLDNYLLEFRTLRNDGTLYNYLLTKLSFFAGNRLLKIHNLYSYSVLFYNFRKNASAESSWESSQRIFYMINQVTRSNNYKTDAYSEYFKTERLKATKGFYDSVQYETHRATIAEIDAQNSYWGLKLKQMTKTTMRNE